MRIKEITSQIRRDFMAIFECEHCGEHCHRPGYDDAYFHSNVIPELPCPNCKKKAGADYRPLTPKYSEHEVV